MRTVMMGVAISAVATLAPGWAWAGNQEVAQEIAGRLANSGQLSDYDVKIKFEKGTAWLRGRVQSKEQMFQAIAIAQGVQGVQKVINEMEVTPGQPQPQIQAETVRPARYAEMPVAEAPKAGPEAMAEPLPKPQPVARMTSGPVRAAPVREPVISQPVQVEQVAGQQEVDPQAMQGQPTLAPPGPAQGMPVAMHGNMPVHGGAPMQGQMMQGQMYQAGMPMMRGPMPMHGGGPIPAYYPAGYGHQAAMRYDQPNMPCYAWPSYAAYPNYAAVTYPRQYSPTAWPYIGPFYPYPQVPLGWRKVTLEWDDGWWMLDFED